MAYKAMPYRGDEYGFPKAIPENLPSSGFEGWIIQEGYPVSLITDIPGFEGTGWFCHCYDDTNTASVYHPDNANYLDPYDPANFSQEPTPEEIAAEANTTFTTATTTTT
jgi:hypothetical protein